MTAPIGKPHTLVTWANWAATAQAGWNSSHARLLFADGVLAMHAGSQTTEGRELHAWICRHDPTWLGQACANAAVMRLSEVDPIHRASAVTPSPMTLPVALAHIRHHGHVNEQLFMQAMCVGQELAIRLAMALGGAKQLMHGVWPSYVVAPLAAAATIGRLRGLSPQHMQHALALAVASASRHPGRPVGERSGRWMLFAQAVRAGAWCAMAAEEGIEGDVGLLSESWLEAMAAGPSDSAWLSHNFDDTLQLSQISFKPHCSAKQGLTAIDGLQQMLAQVDFMPEDVSRVELGVPKAYANMLDREPGWTSRLASMVSAPWQLALTALAPAELDQVERELSSPDTALKSWAAKVSVHHDESLDAYYPVQWPVRLKVHAAGRVHEKLILDSPGDPTLGWNDAQLLDKAKRMLKDPSDLMRVQQALRLADVPQALLDFFRPHDQA
jgi:2-methylcitrate dehydratase PrpD